MNIEARGITGSIKIEGDRLTLSKKGWPYGHKSEKTLALRSITATQWKPAGNLTNGYLQLVYPGSQEKRGGVFDAVKDENAVVFAKKDQGVFEDVREAIASQAPATAPHGQGGLSDELTKLADLRDRGILSDAEFSSQKAKLLG